MYVHSCTSTNSLWIGTGRGVLPSAHRKKPILAPVKRRNLGFIPQFVGLAPGSYGWSLLNCEWSLTMLTKSLFRGFCRYRQLGNLYKFVGVNILPGARGEVKNGLTCPYINVREGGLSVCMSLLNNFWTVWTFLMKFGWNFESLRNFLRVILWTLP
jgi:hypothetical protein